MREEVHYEPIKISLDTNVSNWFDQLCVFSSGIVIKNSRNRRENIETEAT